MRGTIPPAQDYEFALTVNIYVALSENLLSPKRLYLVWVQVPQGRTVNLGQMQVGKNRMGKFTGVTALSEFRIVITAEDLPAVITPSKQEVLTTEVFSVN